MLKRPPYWMRPLNYIIIICETVILSLPTKHCHTSHSTTVTESCPPPPPPMHRPKTLRDLTYSINSISEDLS